MDLSGWVWMPDEDPMAGKGKKEERMSLAQRFAAWALSWSLEPAATAVPLAIALRVIH